MLIDKRTSKCLISIVLIWKCIYPFHLNQKSTRLDAKFNANVLLLSNLKPLSHSGFALLPLLEVRLQLVAGRPCRDRVRVQGLMLVFSVGHVSPIASALTLTLIKKGHS